MTDANRITRGLALGGLLAVLANGIAVLPQASAVEENLGLGLLFWLRGPRVAPPDVAVVAIHPAALRALDLPQRPGDLPRTLYADVIDALTGAGARAIAVDMSFARPSIPPWQDHRLADSIRSSGRVVLLDLLEQRVNAEGVLIESRVPPTSELSEAAAAHGPFPLPKSPPLRVWWARLGSAGDAQTLPVLAAQVAGTGGALPSTPAGEDFELHLDFFGPPRTVTTVGIDRLIHAASGNDADAAWLREAFFGRTVFIGYSAAHPSEQDQVRDDYVTPFTRDDGLALSGVEIAATAFANLLEDRALRPLPPAAHLALLTLGGMLLGMLCIVLPGGYALLAVFMTTAAYLGLAVWRFESAAQWLPIVLPLAVQVPAAVLGGLLWNHVEGRREQQRLGALIDELVPRPVVDELFDRLRRHDDVQREVFGVFLMTDIEGFTAISEGLTPPRAAQLLNDYFGLVFPAIERHGGSVSQINGDAVLAFWFGQGPDPAACRKACLAALEIAFATRSPSSPSASAALPTRIGVHAGAITIGRVGASRHHEYRAVGDAANTTSRIEALSKHLGTRLLASDAVTAAADGILIRPLGRFVLAGKTAPVGISELVAPEAEATEAQRRRCTLFAEALADYRASRWDDAEARWTALLQEFPDDGPSRFYLGLATKCAAELPPPEWDSSIRMESK